MSDEGPLLLSAPKAAKRLGVSVKALRILVRRGLPKIIVGKRLLFVEAEMADWLKREAEADSSRVSAAAIRRPFQPTPISFDEACQRMIARRRQERAKSIPRKGGS